MESMAHVFFGGIIDLTSLVLILWGIMNIPFANNRKVIAVTGVITAILLGISAYYYHRNLEASVIIGTCTVVITVCFLLQGNIFKLIAYSMLSYVLALFLYAVLEGILSVLGFSTEGIFMNRLVSIMVILLLGITTFFRKRKKANLQFHISKKIFALLFAGAGTGLMIIAGLLVEANSRTGERTRRIIIIITIIVVVSYCAACIMMVFITESRDSYKALSQINQSVIDAQQQYFTLVNQKQKEIRSIRHEIKNHLTCINGLYKAGNLMEMEQYLNDLIESSEETVSILDTGNDIVNAILNEAQSRYYKDGIMIRLEGGLPQQLYIAPMDLCVVIANIITNAVEAIQRMDRCFEEKSYVDVKISSFKNDLFIDVKNPIDNNIHIVNGIPVTDKKDRGFHGFGIGNVMKKVEKYHGSFHYYVKNQYFHVEINMKNE